MFYKEVSVMGHMQIGTLSILIALQISFLVISPANGFEKKKDLAVYWFPVENQDETATNACKKGLKNWLEMESYKLADTKDSADLWFHVEAKALAKTNKFYESYVCKLKVFDAKTKALLVYSQFGMNSNREMSAQFFPPFKLEFVEGKNNAVLAKYKRALNEVGSRGVWTMPDNKIERIVLFKWRRSDFGEFPEHQKIALRYYFSNHGISEGYVSDQVFFEISLKSKSKTEALLSYGTVQSRRIISEIEWGTFADPNSNHPVAKEIKETLTNVTDPIEKLKNVRTWSDRSGNFSIQAVYVSRYKQHVYLRRKDNGKLIPVPLPKLSDEDKKIVHAKNSN